MGGAGSMVNEMLPGNGCAGGHCLNKDCKPFKTAVPIGNYAELGFDIQPDYLPNYVVIPTYDDAPDGPIAATEADFKTYGKGNWTSDLVDWFNSKGLAADFFLNTNNWCGDVRQEPTCMATIQKILKTQNPANHTVHHSWMTGTHAFDPMDLSSANCAIAPAKAQFDCEDELKGVEDIVNLVSGGARPHLTRFRAPYGYPFVDPPGPGLADMKKLTKKYAVHVGWNLDSDDSLDSTAALGIAQATAATISKIEDTLGSAPGQGQRYGIVLMHGPYVWSYEASKKLFDPQTGTLIKRGFKMATVEDAICWKYGKHSWDIVNMQGGTGRAAN